MATNKWKKREVKVNEAIGKLVEAINILYSIDDEKPRGHYDDKDGSFYQMIRVAQFDLNDTIDEMHTSMNRYLSDN